MPRQERVEAFSQLVVACSESAKLLDSIEETLDQVTGLVAMPVELARGDPIAARWNDGLCAHAGDGIDERVAVVPLVGDHGIAHQCVDQCGALGNVGHLAASKDQSQWVAQGIHACVNLGA